MRALLVTLLLAGGTAYGQGRSPQKTLPLTELDTQLDIPHRALAGAERVTFTNTSNATQPKVYLWLYANHFERRPAALDDVNFYWIYPYRFDPGFLRVSGVKTAGRSVVSRLLRGDTLLEIDLADALQPGEQVVLELRFDVAVPERYGPFGCTDGSCRLLGGFYPMLATLGPGSWALDAPPARSRFTGTMVTTGGGDALVNGDHQRGNVLKLDVADAPYLAVLIAPRLYEQRRERKGVQITYLSEDPPPPADDASRVILNYTLEDRGTLVLDAVAQAIDLLDELQLPMPEGTHLVLATAATRLELATAQPGMVVLSDRLFELYPARRFRKFHERALERALFTAYLTPAAARLPAQERDAAPEAAAAYLTDLLTIRAYGLKEFVTKVLSPVEFIPTVDNLLYAPQIPFPEAYFANVADQDRFRDDPRRFMNERPHGSLYYEKLRDILDPQALRAAMLAVIAGGKTVRDAAEAAAGRDLGPFFHQWQGRYPEVDYALGAQRRTRGPDGWRHEIDLEKRTPPGESGPVEPVAVRVTDGNGKKYDLTWDGVGTHTTLAVVTKARSLDVVEIDPDSRLVQTTVDGSPDDAKYNDRDPHRWKFLYNSFGALIDFADLSVSLLFDFAIRQIHDVHNLWRLQLYSTEAVTVGGSIGYTYAFGPAVTPLRPLEGLTFTLGLSRLNPNFGVVASAGTRLSLSVVYGYDDRLFLFQPRQANSFAVGARYSVTRFDGGGDEMGAGEILQTVVLSASATKIFTPVDGHTIVFSVGAAMVAGDLVAEPQLLAAGGTDQLRGYGPSEILGRAMILGHAEWRGTLRHDLDWNFGNLFVVHGLEIAGFADAGAVSSCQAYGDMFASRNLFGDVGFGLRIFYDNFGVQPGMTAIDLAVPLVLRPRDCLGSNTIDQSGGRPPFMVYLTLLATFLDRIALDPIRGRRFAALRATSCQSEPDDRLPQP